MLCSFVALGSVPGPQPRPLLSLRFRSSGAASFPSLTLGQPAFLDPGMAPEGSPEWHAGQRCPAPRILVREECRERWGEYVCDGRRNITEIAKVAPSDGRGAGR